MVIISLTFLLAHYSVSLGGDIDQTQSVHINIHDAFVVKYDSGIEISEYLKNRLAVTPSSTRPIQRLLPLHTDQVIFLYYLPTEF